MDLAEAETYFLKPPQYQPVDRPYMDIARNYAAILDTAIPSSMPMGQWSEQVGNEPVRTGFDLNAGIIFSRQNRHEPIGWLINDIELKKVLIPGDEFKIPAVNDSNPRVLPSGKSCSLEQIAVYTDGNRQVRFVESVWNKLSNIHKAGLLVHEALYRHLRAMGDTTSDRTRKVVAYLFGGMEFTWVLDSLPQNFLSCWTEDRAHSFQFIVYPAGKNWVTAQFLVYDGEVMLTKTATYLNAAPFAKALGMSIPLPEDNSFINEIKNPLLDLPTYAFAIKTDSSSGRIGATIESFALAAGKKPKAIACNPHVSTLIYDSDGSVGISRR